jgi:hypothetical protein
MTSPSTSSVVGSAQCRSSPRPDQPLTVFLARQLAEAQLVPHGVQARLVHTEDIVQGAIGDTLLALEQRHHREEHGMELALDLGLLTGVWLHGGGQSHPDEAVPLLIHHVGFCEHEGVFQVRKRGVIKVELTLERPVRDATSLA